MHYCILVLIILYWLSEIVHYKAGFMNYKKSRCLQSIVSPPTPGAELAPDHGLLPVLWYNLGQDVEGVLHLPQPIAKEEAQCKSRDHRYTTLNNTVPSEFAFTVTKPQRGSILCTS